MAGWIGWAMLPMGLLGGAAVAWMLAKARHAGAVETARAAALAEGQTQLAQLTERLRLREEVLRMDQGTLASVRAEADKRRLELDSARDEVARLTERASRVPVLKNDLTLIQGRFRDQSEEMLRVTGESAQRGQAVQSLTARVGALEVETGRLTAKLGQVEGDLSTSNERRATLDEQAAQIPGIERKLADAERQFDEVRGQHATLREDSSSEVARLGAELLAEREALRLVRSSAMDVSRARDEAEAALARLSEELTDLKARQESERTASDEKLALLLHARVEMTDQFKSLAGDILEEKSKRFAEQNTATLGQLLDPLRSQLTDFKGKVEEVYIQEGKERFALSEQVRLLADLNRTIGEEAKNLTRALKGNSKAQGNWGELVLERVLEASGLRKGHEYHVQDSQQREDGTKAIPDVVIHLPEERRLVVDAKMSLVAYQEHVVASTDESRTAAIRRHLDSVNGHIKELSGKKYHLLYQLKSLDFVLMFVPVEPAFMLAVTHDDSLFMQAWEKNVLLVSPSTLLFVVRTVAHLWRQEAQSRNAQDIARRGAELYDRLHDFVKDLETVGSRLNQARESYESAHRRLAVGKGNVIRQAEMLRELGVKPTKLLAAELTGPATDETESAELPFEAPALLSMSAAAAGSAA